MRNFIERIKSYLTRKDCADIAICTWKSANEEVYADFCKRMDAIDKGDLSQGGLVYSDGYISDDTGMYTARSFAVV